MVMISNMNPIKMCLNFELSYLCGYVLLIVIMFVMWVENQASLYCASSHISQTFHHTFNLPPV